jgi:hypothetical protein
MKRVVRNRVTRALLKADGAWAIDSDLKSVMEACEQQSLANVELVLVMGLEPSPEFDISPWRPRW